MSQTRPLKLLAELVSGAGFPAALQGQSDNELPFLKVGDLGRMDSRGYFAEPPDTIDRTTARALGAVMIAPHTPVMAKIGAAINLRRVGVTSSVSCIDNNMVAVVPRTGTHSRYLYYVLNLLDPALLLNGGAVPNINMNWMRHTSLPWFSFDVQRQIADYLDHETAEIDAFVADLEAMRMQLEERWGSALVEIVQGRDHDDVIHTGIDVWPLAPTSWLRTRLKSTVAASTNGVWGEEPASSSGTRCIRVADFDKLRGRVHDLNPTSRQYDASVVSRMGLRDGDLILEKSGGGPTNPVGNVVRYDGGGGDMYSNFVARIRVSGAVDSAYALRLHQSLYASGVTARSVKQTTGIQNLDESAYFDEPVFLPGHDEQKVIARALTAERESTDDAVADIDAAIALAKERRAALITAAVTGQIDVTMKPRPVVDSIQTAIDGSR